jgi:hypothetical protein
LDLIGDGEGLVSSCFGGGLQQMPTQSENSVDFDQSVLSHLLAFRNTAWRKSMRVGADYQNVMKSEL